MKRPPAEPTTPWARLASRLGVEPKKLAILVTVAGGAILVLGVRTMLGGPSKASAKAAAPASAASAAPGAPGAAAPTPSGANGAAGAIVPPPPAGSPTPGAPGAVREETPVIEVHLDTQPRRDPFETFIERPKEAARTAADAPSDASLAPPDLTVFRLRATMDGEWVVVNDQTLRVGDVIGLAPDGTPIKLVEVGHRRAVVEWRGKRFELSFLH